MLRILRFVEKTYTREIDENIHVTMKHFLGPCRRFDDYTPIKTDLLDQ